MTSDYVAVNFLSWCDFIPKILLRQLKTLSLWPISQKDRTFFPMDLAVIQMCYLAAFNPLIFIQGVGILF